MAIYPSAFCCNIDEQNIQLVISNESPHKWYIILVGIIDFVI